MRHPQPIEPLQWSQPAVSPPLSFSDAEIDVVLALAAPLPPENRTRFLEAIAAELAAHGTQIGPARCTGSHRAWLWW
jgi:hypothetical protein